jgi:polyketide synthase Type III
MQKVKLMSLGQAAPQNIYTQKQIFDAMVYPSKFWHLFSDAGIETRHFWMSLRDLTRSNFQEQQEQYKEGAYKLSLEAIRDCLDNRDVRDIGSITFSSCTGFYPGPVLTHFLADELGLQPGLYHTNIGSMGCEGGFPGLIRAMDRTIMTGKPSLAIACELCSCAYYPEPPNEPDPRNHFDLLRAKALFADAAVCAMVGYDDDPRHPVIVDTETYTDTRYLNDLGYVWREGRLRVILSRDVPKIATRLAEIVVKRLLDRHNLVPDHIDYWSIHAAGTSIIDGIRDTLDIPEEKVAPSRRTLLEYGNTSSTSVGLTGKWIISNLEPEPGHYGLMISIGPGMTGGATLFRFDAK